MSRNAVAIVSCFLFVAIALLLYFIPVPYVAWRPGQTIDVLASGESGSAITISGVTTFDTKGKLLMTTVSATRVDSRLSLPEAIVVYLAEDSDAIPREVVYQPGLSTDQVQGKAVAMMDTSRVNATVAALRAAGIAVTEMPRVDGVVSGPSSGILHPGDLILSVDGKAVSTSEEVVELVAARKVGDAVEFVVERGDEKLTLKVTTAADNSDPRKPFVGIQLGTGYSYAPTVNYGIDQGVTGPSAGLIFALGIFDKITDGQLLGDRVVAGTGTIDPNGAVGPIGGVREKIKGAERAGATIFLVPEANCDDIGDLKTDVQLVKVATLKDAIAALQRINEGKTAEEATCG